MTAIVAEFPDFLVRYKQKSIRTILDDGDVEALGAMAVVLLMGAHERRVMGMRAGVLLPVTFLGMTTCRSFQMQIDGWRDGFRDEHARLVSVRRRDDDAPVPDLAEVIVPLENGIVSGPLGEEESPHSLAEATRLWGRRGRVGLDMTEAASLGGAMLGVLRVVCAARGPMEVMQAAIALTDYLAENRGLENCRSVYQGMTSGNRIFGDVFVKSKSLVSLPSDG